MKKTLTLLSLFLLMVAGASAQTMLTMTTLSSAANSPSSVPTAGSGLTGVVQLTSATGVNAPSTSDPTKHTFLYVDRELMDVTAVNGTSITVVRGAETTAGRAHASGALVFVIPAYLDIYGGAGNYGGTFAAPSGSCTRTNEVALPRIQYLSGLISDCVGGQWVTGDALSTQRSVNFELQLPAIGAVAYTSAGTSTTKATNTMYCTELDMPYSKYVTGLAMLNGASTGTDKWILALYDGTGNLLANSAVAGAVASGSSTFQKQAFTTPYYVVGPAQYFACAQGDSGTAATINLIVTGTEDTYLAQKFASQTFGTLSTITVPTTFHTATGGFWFLY